MEFILTPPQRNAFIKTMQKNFMYLQLKLMCKLSTNYILLYIITTDFTNIPLIESWHNFRNNISQVYRLVWFVEAGNISDL